MSFDFSHIRAEMFRELPEDIRSAILENVATFSEAMCGRGIPQHKVYEWSERMKANMVQEAHRSMRLLGTLRGVCAEGSYI